MILRLLSRLLPARIVLPAGAVFVFCALVACSPFQRDAWSPGQSGLQVVEGVPFFPQQERDDCGPAALAALLAHGGRPLPPAEVRAAVYDSRLGGSLLPDLENFARSRGFATRSGRGDLRLLRERIDAGVPVQVLIEAGGGPLRRPHYLVVFGYDERRFLVHNGLEAGVFIAADTLDRRWAAMNRLYLFLPATDLP